MTDKSMCVTEKTAVSAAVSRFEDGQQKAQTVSAFEHFVPLGGHGFRVVTGGLIRNVTGRGTRFFQRAGWLPMLLLATHEPACSAGFPACGFTGLSSPVDQERATGKSPEPAGSKACATNPPRFMVPMRAKYDVEATHEPCECSRGFGLRQPSGAFGSVAAKVKAPEGWRSPRRGRTDAHHDSSPLVFIRVHSWFPSLLILT